ncbi:BlaI/MecI/CopY family transcriptional regulator [Maricaulis sp.]|uniref:BlaI/MecI/CopY family transcriptional regulator n=1 Tax=Maricaulis sp. TaxID=1486257 RepID=UPI002621F9A7|nr:BlaI/MecI/CopY family transcriptional regulator [Maricaulis sp.]
MAEMLNEIENQTLSALWDRGSASLDELALATRSPAGKTLQTLRRLVNKGAVARRRQGQDIVYRPLLNRETARTHKLGRALSGLAMENSGLTSMVVLSEGDLDPQDWADLQAEIAERKARRAAR